MHFGPNMTKKPKIEFVPGCFDNFDGTQEELDDLIKQIHTLVESGELFENSVPLEELDDEELQELENHLNNQGPRFLQ